MKNGLFLIMAFLFLCGCASYQTKKSSCYSKEHWQKVLEQTVGSTKMPDFKLISLFRSSITKSSKPDETLSVTFERFQSEAKVPIFLTPSVASKMPSSEIEIDPSNPGYCSGLKFLDLICQADGLEYKITDDGVLIMEKNQEGRRVRD